VRSIRTAELDRSAHTARSCLNGVIRPTAGDLLRSLRGCDLDALFLYLEPEASERAHIDIAHHTSEKPAIRYPRQSSNNSLYRVTRSTRAVT